MYDSYFARIDRNNRYFALSHGGPVAERHYQHAHESFLAHLPPKGVVVGLGSGDGRHLAYFAERGHTVMGFEPCAERRTAALARGVATVDGTFENFAARKLLSVDGIWCGAALRHIPHRYASRIFRAMGEAIRHGGVLFFTVEIGEAKEYVGLDAAGPEAEILHQQFTEELLALVLGQQNFKVLETWYPPPTDGRKGRWVAILASKS